jgi:hypothetical protein
MECLVLSSLLLTILKLVLVVVKVMAATTTGRKRVTITASDGTQSIDKTFFIKVVASSQVLPPEITNTDVSVISYAQCVDFLDFYLSQ